MAWNESALADPHGRPDKSARVRAMFDEIAPTYEKVNRILSAGRDAYWRRRAVELAGVGSADRVLDVACGTGDFARAFAAAGAREIVGCDFAERMLELAKRSGFAGVLCRSACDAASASPRWVRSDALYLPFADGSFTAAGCAFGVRNWQDLPRGLAEMRRVLRPDGRAVILEFSIPRGPMLGGMYLYYFRRIMPRLATWISGDRSGAYRYLPASVSSFLDEAGLAHALSAAGFSRVEQHRLTRGIVTVTLAWK